MSVCSGPNVSNSGLVFYYDAKNSSKSWKGAPTTNLQLSNIIDWSRTATVSLISELSPIGTPAYRVVDDNASSYLSCSNNITVPNDSNTYTLSIYIKKTFGATSARLGFNSGLTGGATAVQLSQRFNSDTGVSSSGSSEDLGLWWRWQFSLTNNGTGNTSLYCSFFPATGFYDSVDNSSATGTAVVSAIQVEQSSFATPFVNGTRSNTQALLDLTGNNTITANSLTYASDGSFSFNGSSNFASVQTALDAKTIISWVKLSTSAGGDYVVYGLDANGSDNWFGVNANKVNLFATQFSDVNNFTVSGTTDLNTTNFYQICGIIDGQTARVFLNGKLENSVTQAFTIGAWNTAPTISRRGSLTQRYFPGIISSVSVYNRALSEDEVQKNFNAIRGIYGL